MPLLCFVLDTSASMNQKTVQGQRLIDHAKTAIENFISKIRSKDPSARTDQYLLITTQDDQSGLRVGLKDGQGAFWQELGLLQADGLSNLGSSIQMAFDLINCERWENDLDSIGRGRLPWMIKPAAIIVITDGGKLTSSNQLKPELIIPGSTLPGAIYFHEPFRWDQRVFSLALRFSANDDSENAKMSGANDQLGPLCKVTGGRSHTVNSPKNLLESLHLIGQKIQSSSGVMVNFERLSDSPSNGRPELGSSNEPKPWYNTTGMVNVRQNYKTRNFQGYWPIPESFWADPNEPKCPPRYATPTLKFSSKDCKPLCLQNFAFDKLELESSPLTVALLERNRTDVCWQVFVDGSGKFGGISKPIGYLKANTQNTMVNLFIHPYDYEEALTLIEELFRSNMNPSPIWRKKWDEYLSNIPNYYIPHFRKALLQAHVPNGVISDAFDIKLNSTIQAQLTKVKMQLRNESEKLNEQIKKNRMELNVERPISVKQIPHIHIQTEQTENYTNFLLLNKQRNIRKRPFLEAFDVARDSILSQLKRMRMSFRHSLKCGIPIHKEDILHEQSISQMGKYEQYIKNNIVPLRDPDPDARPTAKPTFGNPYKRGKDLLDVDGMDGLDGLNDRLGGGLERRNRNKRNKEIEKPKKRIRKLSTLSLRSRSDNSSDSESRDSQGQSETDSDMDDSVFKDDSPTDNDHQPLRIDHSKHNGYGHMTNGHSEHNNRGEHNHHMMSNGKKEREHMSKMSSKNREIFEKLDKLVKQPGIKDFVFGQSLSDLELNEDNMEEIISRCRQLQVETIRFTRWRLMDMLEDFIKSQIGSFEAK